jgi:oxygen-independent coproporphyrinogen-3 oxidase
MELPVQQNPRPDATEVGSYFVANYPPFSAWSRDHTPAVEQTLATAGPSPAPPLGLYLHIPFCRKRCKFCYFRVYTDKNASEVETYLAGLAAEIALYARQPRLAGRQFEFVYFGGGTPSFLSAEQLKRLIGRINEHFEWSAAREVTFECEPGTLQEHKLAAIRNIGVTRLSLGVEHFDDEVLTANGRAHKSKEIYRAWEWVKSAGFPQVNIDLIAGMVGETDDRWRFAVDEALRLQPDSVTIYQMELPHNAVFSKEQKETGRQIVATWAQKRAWVDYAFRQFEAAGYVVSSGYTLLKPGPNAQFVYRDSLWHGADLVGTGVASFSHVGGVHYQNEDRWENYLGALDAGRLPLSRALPITKEQALRRELILQLKLGRLDLGYFTEKFGIDPQQALAEPLQSLVQEGWADLSPANGRPAQLRLTRDGLLRVDELLHRFFEPQFRGVRYT